MGGVKPGLDQDEDQPLQGPEPLMGIQHLDQVEKGEMTSGDEAVLAAASHITCAHTPSCCKWTSDTFCTGDNVRGDNLSVPMFG